MIQGKEKVNKDTKVEDLYKTDAGLNFFAVEGFGTPFKWKRFEGPNGDNTWHNSGSSYDRIAFVPQKDIAFAGFSTFAAKTDSKYFIKYKIDIDGVVIIDQNQPVECSNFQDKYYNRIIFETPYDVKALSKIHIMCWISGNFSNSSNVLTYYGSNGGSYDSIKNEHMGLFKLEEPGSSSNGTSISYGHYPEIFYYL